MNEVMVPALCSALQALCELAEGYLPGNNELPESNIPKHSQGHFRFRREYTRASRCHWQWAYLYISFRTVTKIGTMSHRCLEALMIIQTEVYHTGACCDKTLSFLYHNCIEQRTLTPEPSSC